MFQIIVGDLKKTDNLRYTLFQQLSRNIVRLLLSSAVVVFEDVKCKSPFRQKLKIFARCSIPDKLKFYIKHKSFTLTHQKNGTPKIR